MRRRHTSDIKDIGSSIQQLVDGLGIRNKIAEYEAVLRWESIVGGPIAKATMVVRIVKGVLVVKVRNSTWRNELVLRKQDIIRSLNKDLGEDVVKDIRFQ